MEPLDPAGRFEQARLEVHAKVPGASIDRRRPFVVPLRLVRRGPPAPIQEDANAHAAQRRVEGGLEERVRSSVPFRVDVEGLDPHALPRRA